MNQHPILVQQVVAERHRQIRDGFAGATSRGIGKPRPTRGGRSAVATMYLGLAATVVTTVIPYVDRSGLVRHIRAGYPTYGEARIDKAATIYVVYLSVVGVLGLAGWLCSIRAARAGKRWASGAATAMFLVGTSVALTDLLIKDTSGDTGLPTLLGWVGLLPSLPGLLAVALLWSRRSA